MIPVAAAVQTSLPTTGPMPDRINLFQLSVFAGWTAVAIVLAISAGFFRRRTIVGPERLPVLESGWQLIGIGLFGYSATWFIISNIWSSARSLPVAVQTIVLNGLFQGICFPITAALLLFTPGQSSIVRDGLSLKRLPFGALAGSVAWAVVFPICSLMLTATTLVCIRYHVIVPPHPVLETIRQSRSIWLVVAGVFVAVIIAPLNEELLFRACIQTGIGRVLTNWTRGPEALSGPIPRWSAVVLTAAGFAAMHFGQIAATPTLFILALGLGYTYERTGNLWAPFFVHMLFNLTETVFSFWLT